MLVRLAFFTILVSTFSTKKKILSYSKKIEDFFCCQYKTRNQGTLAQGTKERLELSVSRS